MKEAALFGCAVTTGFGVIENTKSLNIGSSVVVFGSGGVGLNIVQAASLVSCYPIIAIDKFENRLKLSSKFGATHTINSLKADPFNLILKILGSKPLDLFIDNTGVLKIIEEGYKLIKKDGVLKLVGVPKLGDNISIYSLPMHFGKKIIGTHGGDGDPSKDIPRYEYLAKKGLINLSNIITETISINEINFGINNMKNGNTSGKTLIKF